MPSKSKALTLRFDASRFRRLAALAAAENRTPTNYVETLVLREMQAKDAANRIISVQSVPETVGIAPGPLARTPGESRPRYRRRQKIFDRLISLPHSD